MASIIKRKKNYSVVYNYVDEKRRNQTKVGDLAYPQRGLEAQGGNRKSAAHGNFFYRQAIRRSPSSFMTSYLFTEKRNGACLCMTAKRR